jgi:precorrin-4 methylase
MTIINIAKGTLTKYGRISHFIEDDECGKTAVIVRKNTSMLLPLSSMTLKDIIKELDDDNESDEFPRAVPERHRQRNNHSVRSN